MTLSWLDHSPTLKTLNLSLFRFVEQSRSKNHLSHMKA